MNAEANPHLMTALDFDADDLAANRAGKLSARQQQSLTNQRRVQGWLLTLGVALTLIAVVLVLRVRVGGALILWVAAAVAVWALGFGPAQTLFRWLGYDRDVKLGTAQIAEGPLAFKARPGRRAIHTLEIGGQVWELDATQQRRYRVFQHGQAYRLYYTAGSRTILAAERVGDAHPI
jgi:hypothetical protein